MMFKKGQKIFLSFAFTGEPKDEVTQRMQRIVAAMEGSGLVPYCNLFDDRTSGFMTPGQYVTDAIERVKESDGFIMIKTNANRSEGQLSEFGAAKAMGISVGYLLHESATDSTYLNDPMLSDETRIWTTEDDLVDIAARLIA